MRDVVEKILRTEAMRLFEKAQDQGLNKDDLGFLDKLISTHKNFIGEATPSEPTELPPDQQSTSDLLSAVPTGPESVNEASK